MHKISLFVVATALILTAGIGGWTALTTTDVKGSREGHKYGL